MSKIALLSENNRQEMVCARAVVVPAAGVEVRVEVGREAVVLREDVSEDVSVRSEDGALPYEFKGLGVL